MGGVIWGEQVGIRPLGPFDAGAIRRFMLDREVAHLLFEEMLLIPPSTFAMAMALWAARLANQPEYGIITRDGRLIGSTKLWRISEQNRSAMLTIYIGERQNWGRGYGTEALRLILREGFGRLGLKRVELHVFDFNERAIRSYEKAGFLREGMRRQALSRGATYHDIWVMGILREEFEAREAERRSAAGQV